MPNYRERAFSGKEKKNLVFEEQSTPVARIRQGDVHTVWIAPPRREMSFVLVQGPPCAGPIPWRVIVLHTHKLAVTKYKGFVMICCVFAATGQAPDFWR